MNDSFEIYVVDNFVVSFLLCISLETRYYIIIIMIYLLFLSCNMENGKVHIRHVMQLEFKQGNCAKMTFDKMCSRFSEGRITDLTVRKWL